LYDGVVVRGEADSAEKGGVNAGAANKDGDTACINDEVGINGCVDTVTADTWDTNDSGIKGLC